MKRLLFVFMIFGWITFLADAQEVRSPDENVRAVFEVKDSIPYYSIFYKDREIISSGRLGLDLITDEFEKQGIKIAADRYSLKDGFEISDRKSTRLNSSHVAISYAVFCLKKKK